MGADSVRQRRLAARTIKEKIAEGACSKRNCLRKWRVASAVALTITCFVLYQWLSVNEEFDLARLSEEDRNELRRLEPALIANLTEGSPWRLGHFCDSHGDCFVVDQRYFELDGILMAQRIIMYELNPMMALTVSRLRVPEIVTAHHLVHERWRIDHARLDFSYNLLQIAAGFMLEGLSFNSTRQQRVLQIGMGGGSATGFLANIPLDLRIDVVELEPAVYETAKRWFDFPKSPNVSVRIMDGVVFLKEAAAKGITYDSLILDASTNSPDSSGGIVCPHPVFLQEDVLEAMSKVIGDRGVFSANLFMPQDQLRLQEKVALQIAAHFRSCSALKISAEGQKFILCSNREGFDWTRERDRIVRNLEAFDDRMDTRVASFLYYGNPLAQ